MLIATTLRRAAVLGAVALATSAGAVVVTAAPAQAVSCGSPGLVTAVLKSLTQNISYQGPRNVTLQLINIRTSDYSYAFLGGSGGSGVQQGDRVWVEWRATASSPWERCPSSEAVHNNQTFVKSTGAFNINHPMRACLSYLASPAYRNTVCTASHTDHPE
jgi:hypothetical protein